jgi:hypothetical protein
MLAVFATVLCPVAGPAGAAGHADARAALELTLGGMDVFDGPRPFAGGLEYRWAPLGSWALAPGAGLLAGSDGSRYAHASLSRRFALGSAWHTTVVFGAGHFHDGSVVRLGHEAMFRSGLELGRALGGPWRLALAFDHLSNAGLGEDNPGTELLSLRLSAALGGTARAAALQAGNAPPVVAPDAGADAAASWRSSSRRISSPASAR